MSESNPCLSSSLCHLIPGFWVHHCSLRAIFGEWLAESVEMCYVFTVMMFMSHMNLSSLKSKSGLWSVVNRNSLVKLLTPNRFRFHNTYKRCKCDTNEYIRVWYCHTYDLMTSNHRIFLKQNEIWKSETSKSLHRKQPWSHGPEPETRTGPKTRPSKHTKPDCVASSLPTNNE